MLATENVDQIKEIDLFIRTAKTPIQRERERESCFERTNRIHDDIDEMVRKLVKL